MDTLEELKSLSLSLDIDGTWEERYNLIMSMDITSDIEELRLLLHNLSTTPANIANTCDDIILTTIEEGDFKNWIIPIWHEFSYLAQSRISRGHLFFLLNRAADFDIDYCYISFLKQDSILKKEIINSTTDDFYKFFDSHPVMRTRFKPCLDLLRKITTQADR